MTTVQIIGIAVASLAVLLLVVALIATRRRHEEPSSADARPDGGSFLDQAPQDTFSGLGKAEHPVEDVTFDPAVERAAAANLQAQSERPPQPGGLGLDWGPDLSVKTTALPEEPPAPAESAIAPAPADDETQITGELAPADVAPTAPEPSPLTPGGTGGSLVPLSDIIVTTSDKMVDLQDPDVRRMLTELVTFEIDQAAELRRQGQTIDAVLQLTEAEKVSRALGMYESAQRIHEMMEEIRGA